MYKNSPGSIIEKGNTFPYESNDVGAKSHDLQSTSNEADMGQRPSHFSLTHCLLWQMSAMKLLNEEALRESQNVNIGQPSFCNWVSCPNQDSFTVQTLQANAIGGQERIWRLGLERNEDSVVFLRVFSLSLIVLSLW